MITRNSFSTCVISCGTHLPARTGPTFFRGEIWYNNPRTPIYSKSKDVHGIDGFGYKWRHNTMDWEQGCEEVLKLFRNVSNSTWLPMYDFDFWILPYLEGKGMSMDQIKRFVTACGDVLANEIDEPRGGKRVTDRQVAENKLRQVAVRSRTTVSPLWQQRLKFKFQN